MVDELDGGIDDDVLEVIDEDCVDADDVDGELDVGRNSDRGSSQASDQAQSETA